MNIFDYNAETGELMAGVREARQDPRNPGEFLLPAYSTFIEPPAVGIEQAAIFIDGAWQVVIDHRGQYWLADGSTDKITDLGVERPINAFTVAPLLLVTAVVDAKKFELSAACDNDLRNITTIYPAAERATWDIQRQEALAWQADNNSAVPFIDALATERGVTTADQVTQILTKIAAFEAAAATAIGKRQRLIDQVDVIVADVISDDDKRTAIGAVSW